jgi:ParB-like chromosome segregation protein Spo0J
MELYSILMGALESSGKCRLELVAAKLIKRMPGLNLGVSQKKVGKARDFSRERGYYRPIVLSESQGCMALLAGAVTYEACLKDKAAKIPAVIVRTDSEADGLMFALQSADLDEPPGAIAVSAAIVQLIDTHGVARKQIAKALGKSPAWINRMENLSRKLNGAVQKMVAEGQISSRAAQEISRLPDDAQTPFAIAAANEFLSKENVTYLINRYLNKDTGAEERDRIIRTPKRVLPNESKRRGRIGIDCSDSARLTRAIARCLDDGSYLSALLDRIDVGEVAVRNSDIEALSDSLASLRQKVQSTFYPGKNKGGADD